MKERRRITFRGNSTTNTYHSLDHLPKNDMSAIKPRRLYCRDKKLGTVGVLTSIGHAQPARSLVFQLKVLIGELVAIDTFTCKARERASIMNIIHSDFN